MASVPRDLDDFAIARISHVDDPARIDRDAIGMIERVRRASKGADIRIWRDLADRAVVQIRDENIALAVDSDAKGILESRRCAHAVDFARGPRAGKGADRAVRSDLADLA